MAKNKVYIDIEINGKMQKVAVDAKNLGRSLEQVGEHAQTADRRLKGAAQASSNGTKNFSKMAQGLTGGLVPAYAAVAAQVFALSAAFNFLKNAADVQNLKAAQISYANSTGVAMQSLTKNIQAASGQMLGFQEAAQAAAIGAAKGFTGSQMADMATAAGKAAAALGRNYQDTFDRIVRGVSKAEPELLDELGVTLRLEKATKDYAAAIGQSQDSLTAAQRSQAVYVETMRQLNDNFGQVKQAVNPFQQLAVTMQNVARTVTEALLPGFIGIADFINKNAQAAVVVFAGLVGMVLLNITGLKEGVKSMFTGIGSSAASAGTSLKSTFTSWTDSALSGASAVVDKMEEVEQSLKSAAELQKGKAGSAAKAMMDKGASSKALARVAAGEDLSPVMKGALLKNLEKVKKELKETGETASKAFKGATLESVEKFEEELKAIGKTSLTTGQKIKRSMGKVAVGALKKVRSIAKLAASATKYVGWAAEKAAKGFKMLGKATVVLSIIGYILEGFEKVANAPATAIQGFINFVVKFASIMDKLINTIIAGVNKIPGIKVDVKSDLAGKAKEGLTSLGNAALEGMGYTGENGETALQTGVRREKQAAEEKQRVDDLIESYADLGKEMANLAEGARKKTGSSRTAAVANSIASLPIAGAMKEAAKSPEAKKAFDDMLKSIDIGAFGAVFASAVKAGDVAAVEKLQTAAGVYTASLTEIKDKTSNIKTLLKDGDPLQTRIFLQNLTAAAEAGDKAARTLGEEAGLAGILDNELGVSVDRLTKDLLALEARFKSISADKFALDMRKISSSANMRMFQEEDNRSIALQEKSLEIRRKRAELTQLEMVDITGKTVAEQEAHGLEVLAMERTISLMEKEKDILEDNLSVTYRLGRMIGDSLGSNLASAFNALIDGTKNLKTAFKDMALAILKDIAQMMAKLTAMAILKAALQGTGFGSFIGVPAKRYGGVVQDGKDLPGYAVGGVASGPQSGYPVMMHGTEAVVPLPNGKSIPVEMRGSNQNNNVTVNVSVEGSTRTEESSGPKAADLGKVIAQAVQQELQNQKRSGGILNPYGVA